jgi:hypothetical protein
MRLLAALGLVTATLLTTGPASAALVDSIDALNPGDMYRVIFMTSTVGLGTSTDIGVYNQRVNDAASAGSVTNPLGLSWTALASTTAVNAQTNTGVSNADIAALSFFNTDGDLIATSGADLWSAPLLAAILYDENGVSTGNENDHYLTWTGTDATGATSDPLGGVNVRSGDAAATDFHWMANAVNPNTFQRSLYGVSAGVTVVPEPTTLPLVGLAVLGTVFWRRRISFAAA